MILNGKHFIFENILMAIGTPPPPNGHENVDFFRIFSLILDTLNLA